MLFSGSAGHMWVLYEILGYVCDQCDRPCLALGCTEISQYLTRTMDMRVELEKLQSDMKSGLSGSAAVLLDSLTEMGVTVGKLCRECFYQDSELV